MNRRYDHRKSMPSKNLDYIRFAVFSVVVAIVIVVLLIQHNKSPLPKAIDKQVSFVVYYPGDGWAVASKDITYDGSANVLTLMAKQKATTLTVTEQAAPSQFTDIPQYYSSLIDKLNEYQSFGSANGTVYLTHPTELSGGTEAVLTNDGTLLFAHPDNTLSTAGWRQFFNGLKQLK